MCMAPCQCSFVTFGLWLRTCINNAPSSTSWFSASSTRDGWYWRQHCTACRWHMLRSSKRRMTLLQMMRAMKMSHAVCCTNHKKGKMDKKKVMTSLTGYFGGEMTIMVCSMPPEEDLNSWSHHFNPTTCDDEAMRLAMR